MKDTISIDKKSRQVAFEGFTSNNPIVFNYFSQLPVKDRAKRLQQALHIGVIALMEDRIAAFLANTKNELGTELENLKLIYDFETLIFEKTAIKGKSAEEQVGKIINEYFRTKQWRDYALLTTELEGDLPKNKTGDIMCFIDGDENKKLVIEVKFQKTLQGGEISHRSYNKNTTSIWGQLIEARANRDAETSIIVIEESLAEELGVKYGPISFIPSVGMVALVNSKTNNYDALFGAYNVLRLIAINQFIIDKNSQSLLRELIEKLLFEANNLLSVKKDLEAIVKSNEAVIERISKSIQDIEITKDYIEESLSNGKLSPKRLHTLYTGNKETKD